MRDIFGGGGYLQGDYSCRLRARGNFSSLLKSIYFTSLTLMAQIVSESVTVPHQALRDFTFGCLKKVGLSAENAKLVSNSLVESNLRGIDSHGVARLPHYINRIRHGSITPNPEQKFTRISPALGRLDGNHGMGQVVMQRATEEAIKLGREAGAGWVAVENSTHCGALAYYGQQIAKADMIALVFTHSDSMVVPHGARHAFCGTNPLCFAVPGEDGRSLCLDMATSVVPWNTVLNAGIEGVEIPDHWAVDSAGDPTTSPDAVAGVHAFGDYKGSGLGLMIDVFCSFLLESPYGPHIGKMYGDPSVRRLLGGLVGAIDISRFQMPSHFRKNISRLMKEWNAQQPYRAGDRVLYPGEPEEITRAHRVVEGIPLGINLLTIFEEVSQELDVPWDPCL